MQTPTSWAKTTIRRHSAAFKLKLVGLMTHFLVGEYCDHLPLYRQSQIYEREGVDIDHSTVVDWVAGCARLLQPLPTCNMVGYRNDGVYPNYEMSHTPFL